MKLTLLLLLVNVFFLVNGQDSEDEDVDEGCRLFNTAVRQYQEGQQICQLCVAQCLLEEKDMIGEDGYPNVDKTLDWLYPEEEFPQSRPIMSHLLDTCISRTKKLVIPDDICDGYAYLIKCLYMSLPKICPGNEPCRNPKLSESDEMNLMKCLECGGTCVMEWLNMVDINGNFTTDSLEYPYDRMDREMVTSCMDSARDDPDTCSSGATFFNCLFTQTQSACQQHTEESLYTTDE